MLEVKGSAIITVVDTPVSVLSKFNKYSSFTCFPRELVWLTRFKGQLLIMLVTDHLVTYTLVPLFWKCHRPPSVTTSDRYSSTALAYSYGTAVTGVKTGCWKHKGLKLKLA